MKTKYLALVACVFCIFCNSLNAQKTILIKQEEIIGSLPYGVHFYLRGSAVLPSGEVADSVVVQIYQTSDKYLTKKQRRQSQVVTRTQKEAVISNKKNLVEETTWVRYKDKDATDYEVYVNQPLSFGREYLVVIQLYRRYNFVFSDEEQMQILDRVKENTAAVFANDGVLTTEDAADYLNSAIYTAMRQKVQMNGDKFYGLNTETKATQLLISERNSAMLYNVTKEYLENVNSLAAQNEVRKNAKSNLEKAENDLEEAQNADNPSAGKIRSAEKRQERSNTIIKETNSKISKLRATIDSDLTIIGNQLVLVSVQRTAGSVLPLAVTDIDAIKIGTSIGGGGIFFNPQNDELRDVNALAYTALKFYFFPVDKRVSQPYLTNSPLNRASFLFGAITSNSFEYRGQELDKPIGLAPLAGISYDVNRYFSIDVAATVFRQPYSSILIDRKKTRFAPVVGITFDFDAFNRIKNLTNNQGPYNLSPTSN